MKTHTHINNAANSFNWSRYTDGFVGGNHLVVNSQVKTAVYNDKVYCHDDYAQQLYDIYNGKVDKDTITPKDEISGNIYNITDIHVKSDHELLLDSDNGNSISIDLNKEKAYVDAFNGATIMQITDAIRRNGSFKKELIDNGMRVKVVGKNKVSLWEGHKSFIEEEFTRQYTKSTDKQYAYIAKVLSTNNGGYIVDIRGVHCFLPGSLAASGIVTNFEVLLGKEIPVMIVNYMQKTKCWVVSHKKYIDFILPNKIKTELSIGQSVTCRISGMSKNGIFVSFQDSEGEWIFSGLCHRSVMSTDLQSQFDNKKFAVGDELTLLITSINYTGNTARIVLGDIIPDPTNNKSIEQKEQ